jgi:hypothetical protein
MRNKCGFDLFFNSIYGYFCHLQDPQFACNPDCIARTRNPQAIRLRISLLAHDMLFAFFVYVLLILCIADPAATLPQPSLLSSSPSEFVICISVSPHALSQLPASRHSLTRKMAKVIALYHEMPLWSWCVIEHGFVSLYWTLGTRSVRNPRICKALGVDSVGRGRLSVWRITSVIRVSKK